MNDAMRHAASPRRLALLGALAFALCSSANADSITFSGTNIPLRDCKIEAFQGGQVTYVDVAHQRQRRPLEQVTALGFSGLPQLDQAEEALAQNDLDSALANLLVAFTSAGTEMQRLWLHARLARVHDMRHEYVQAAGHAAAAMMLSDDPYWSAIEPSGDANEPNYPPDYPAAKEAMDDLQNAARKVKATQLKSSVDRMIRKTQPVYERLAKAYSGPTIASGSTVSGISKQDIVSGKLEIKPRPPTPSSDQPAPSAPAKSPPVINSAKPPAAEAPTSSGSDSPAAIDALLNQSKWTEALALCERLSANPGDRDLAHLLVQTGSALVHVDRAEDAAVMFARCAVLFPDSVDADHALIQLAVVYRDHYHKPETARRLLQRAVDQATAQGHDSAAMLARELLGSL